VSIHTHLQTVSYHSRHPPCVANAMADTVQSVAPDAGKKRDEDSDDGAHVTCAFFREYFKAFLPFTIHAYRFGNRSFALVSSNALPTWLQTHL